MKLLHLHEVVLLGATIALLILERIGVLENLTPHIHVLAILVFTWYLIADTRRFSQHGLMTIYQVYYWFGMMLSAVFVASGIEMLEIGATGTANGTFWLLGIFCILSQVGSRVGFLIALKKLPRGHSVKLDDAREKLVTCIIAATLIVISGYLFVYYAGPLTAGISRVVFWADVVPSGLAWVGTAVKQTFFLIAAVAIGVYFWPASKSTRYVLLMLLFSYVAITIFLLGEKFSAFVIYASMFGIAVSPFPTAFYLNKKVMVASAVVIIGIGFLILYNYVVLNNYGGSFVVYRIAMQSQVVWSLLNDSEGWLNPNVSLTTFFGGGYENAADMISAKLLPTPLYLFYSESRTTLSGFFPGLQIMSFGLALTIVLHILVSFILGVLSFRLQLHLSRRSYLYSFLIFKLYFAIIFFWYAAIHTALMGAGFFVLLVCIFVAKLLMNLNVRRGLRPS